MNSNPHDPGSQRREPDVAEQNIARLLSRAYQPEPLDPAFVRRVHDKLQVAARQIAADKKKHVLRSPRLRWPLAAAAALLVLILALHAILRQFSGPGTSPSQPEAPSFAKETRTPMTPRIRPAAPAVGQASVGDRLETGNNER